METVHNLGGGGHGPGSSDNLTLDLVSAAAANAPSLIKKIDLGALGRSVGVVGSEAVFGCVVLLALILQRRDDRGNYRAV